MSHTQVVKKLTNPRDCDVHNVCEANPVAEEIRGKVCPRGSPCPKDILGKSMCVCVCMYMLMFVSFCVPDPRISCKCPSIQVDLFVYQLSICLGSKLLFWASKA